MDGRLLWLCVSWFRQQTGWTCIPGGIHSCTAYSALPAPTEMHTAPTKMWIVEIVWCWSSILFDQSESPNRYEDNNNPLSNEPQTTCITRNWSPVPTAPLQLLCHKLLTALSVCWSRLMVFQAVVSQHMWPTQYPDPATLQYQPHEQLTCLPATVWLKFSYNLYSHS